MTCTCHTTSLQHSYGCPFWTDPVPLATENAKLKAEIETLRTALRRLVRLYESEHEPEDPYRTPWPNESFADTEGLEDGQAIPTRADIESRAASWPHGLRGAINRLCDHVRRKPAQTFDTRDREALAIVLLNLIDNEERRR